MKKLCDKCKKHTEYERWNTSCDKPGCLVIHNGELPPNYCKHCGTKFITLNIFNPININEQSITYKITGDQNV